MQNVTAHHQPPVLNLSRTAATLANFPQSFYCRAQYHMIWNIPLVTLGQPFCPLFFERPQPQLSQKQKNKQTTKQKTLCKHCSKTAKTFMLPMLFSLQIQKIEAY